jgi:hypothetical protein
MRNRIFGAIGVIWGGYISFNNLSRGMDPAPDANFRAGQYVGAALCALMFIVGLYYLIVGDGDIFRKKKKKKKKGAIRTPI